MEAFTETGDRGRTSIGLFSKLRNAHSYYLPRVLGNIGGQVILFRVKAIKVSLYGTQNVGHG
jgi:hypothetical protein